MNQNADPGRTIQHIGIEVHGGTAVVLIPAGSRTPVARAMTFTTVADGQGAVEVRVVRCTAAAGPGPGGPGPSRPAGVVGRFLVPGLRRGPRGEARIDIGISLDREGVLRAWGADRHTGARQEGVFPGFWALAPLARPAAVARLAGFLDEQLARQQRTAAGEAAQERLAWERGPAPGAFLAALAGEIEAVRRSTLHPPVEVG